MGDKIDIRKITEGEAQLKNDFYCSQLIEILDAIRIKITMPTIGTSLVPLTPGMMYDCVFYTSQGLRQGLFQVVTRFKEGNLPVIIMELKSSLRKVQRREFYRMDCTLPLKYRIADKEEKIPKEFFRDLEWKNGVILDLSGGGMRFVVEEPIKKDDFLHFKMVLSVKEEYRELYIYGDVVHSKTKENNIRLHECRTQFNRISEVDQDYIVSYIFEKERKKRSRELQ